MASIKQVEANRRNSQKSTGPRTSEGNAAVRLNALRHGLCARTAVLPTENAEEFHQLCADLETEWQPQGRTEQYLLEQMAVSQWKAARAARMEHNLYDKGNLSEARTRLLDHVLRQQTRWERAYFKALRDLQSLQKPRPPQIEPAPPPVEAQPEPASKTNEQSHSDQQPSQNESDAPVSAQAGQEELPGTLRLLQALRALRALKQTMPRFAPLCRIAQRTAWSSP
jgi:hypothetical protein